MDRGDAGRTRSPRQEIYIVERVSPSATGLLLLAIYICAGIAITLYQARGLWTAYLLTDEWPAMATFGYAALQLLYVVVAVLHLSRHSSRWVKSYSESLRRDMREAYDETLLSWITPVMALFMVMGILPAALYLMPVRQALAERVYTQILTQGIEPAAHMLESLLTEGPILDIGESAWLLADLLPSPGTPGLVSVAVYLTLSMMLTKEAINAAVRGHRVVRLVPCVLVWALAAAAFWLAYRSGFIYGA